MYVTVIIPLIAILSASYGGFLTADIISILLYLLVVFAFLYFIGYFTLFTFENQEEFILKRYILRPFWSTKEIPYSKLYSIEVRRINGSHQLPLLLIHFNKKQEGSTFFFSRSFPFGKRPVENFLLAAKKHGVRIKFNVDKEYKKEYVRFKSFAL